MSVSEKLARAIFYADKASGPWATGGRPGETPVRQRLAVESDLVGWDEQKDHYLDLANAALNALRINRLQGIDRNIMRRLIARFPVLVGGEAVMEELWSAMIDEALK